MNPENTPTQQSATPQPIAPQQKKSSFLRELITFLIIAVFVVLPFRWFIAEPYIVSGTSMFPTFDTGHYLIVDKITWHFDAPKRYDVVVMVYPKDTTKDFIKRIVGLPGDTVIVKDGAVTIKNTDNPQGFALNQSFVMEPKTDGSDNMTVTLKNNEYFVMGDNRAGSFDSRYWGPLPASDIIGYPILRLLPLSKIGIMPGAESVTVSGSSSS